MIDHICVILSPEAEVYLVWQNDPSSALTDKSHLRHACTFVQVLLHYGRHSG